MHAWSLESTSKLVHTITGYSAFVFVKLGRGNYMIIVMKDSCSKYFQSTLKRLFLQSKSVFEKLRFRDGLVGMELF